MRAKNKLYSGIPVLLLTFAFFLTNLGMKSAEVLASARHKPDYYDASVNRANLAPALMINQSRVEEIFLGWVFKPTDNPRKALKIETVEKHKSDLFSAKEDTKVLILDLDDTLYSSDDMNKAVLEAWHDFMISKIKDKLNISRTQAAALLDQEKRKIIARFKNSRSRKPSYTEISEDIAAGYDLRIEDWENFKDQQIKPKKYLSQSLILKNILDNLVLKYELVLVTNNTRSQTIRILEALGIKDHTKYFKILKTNARKPNTRVFQFIAQQLSVLPKQCVSIGDSYDKDIKPALILGMKGIHISSYKEFLKTAAAFSLEKTDILNPDFLSLQKCSLPANQFMPLMFEKSI
ncbi:MAG: HAD family hydrolase [Candidatus Omnitrophota bacterium]